MSYLKSRLRQFMRKWDRDIFQVSCLALTNSIIRKQEILAAQKIDLVLDVGANEGQYGRFLRDHVRYDGVLVSYEPLTSVFQTLKDATKGDANWRAVNLALGSAPGSMRINVAGNSQSSSLLPMLDQHRDAAPTSAYVGTEEITVSTLDLQAGELGLRGRNVYLKIDTQGFEKSVLDGAVDSLSSIGTIELEMSFVPLYGGQLLFGEMKDCMRQRGFVMIDIEPMFRDPRTGEILQADVVFQRATNATNG